MTQKQSGGKQNTYSRLSLTQRQHACSIHINTQYQIMTPACKQLTRLWVSLNIGLNVPVNVQNVLFLASLYIKTCFFFCVNMPRVVL